MMNNSEYKSTADFDSVIELAQQGIGEDKLGFRTEFLHLADLMRYMSENVYNEGDFEINY